MDAPISEAKAQLTELVRRAEAGDEIVLTRHGQPAVRLVPVKVQHDRATRRRALEAARRAGAAVAHNGETAARSQDFIYGEDGVPA